MRRLAIHTAALAICLLALGAQGAAAAKPTIVKTTVSKVSTDSAVLGGEVNPGSKTTLYRFEYGPENCEISACTSVPVPEGVLSPASSSVPLTPFALEGLTPGTTYHLRIVARNSDGEVKGLDRIFATYVSPFTGLPDGRVYEQASPVEKNAADARGTTGWVKAAKDGDRVSFLSTSGIPGGEGGQEIPAYLASRDASDWSTQGLLPRATLRTEALVRGWLSDFSAVFDFARDFGGGTESAFVSRSSADGTLIEIFGEGDGITDTPSFAGASADGSKVIFETRGKLPCCPEALAGKSNVYLWDRDSGQITLVSVLNNEKPPSSPQGSGGFAGPYDWMGTPILPLSTSEGGSAKDYYTQDLHAISSDASKVYFTAAGTGQLYMRINPSEGQSALDADDKCTEPDLACTIEVSATHRTQPDPLGSRPAAFMAATPDAAFTFFASPEELTNDANTGPVQPPPAIESATAASGPPINSSFPITASGIAIDAEYVYWANPSQDAIGRADLADGENANPTFIQVPPRKECPSGKPDCTAAEEEVVGAKPQYVAVDDEHIYWTNERSGNKGAGTIGRADINGGPLSVEENWIEGASQPKGIAVNATQVLWANAGSGFGPEASIGSADIDGDPVLQDFIESLSGSERFEGLAVDASHIYWTVNVPNGSISNGYIRHGDIDGSNLESTFIGTNAELRGIVVDAGHVYWASQGEKAIGRANLDLTGVANQFIPTSGKPKGLAVNATDLYWSVNGEVAPNPGNDLYRYRSADESLADITPDVLGAPNGAEVKGVLGASEDGKRVYFAANGDLDGAGEAGAGDCVGKLSSTFSFSGHCNLYLAEEASPGAWSTTFIAPLDAGGVAEESDAVDWIGRGGSQARYQRSSMVSADGSVLIFRSQEKLTPYDNEGRPELYRYEAGAQGPTCLSCNPTGEAPTGSVALGSIGLSALEPQLAPAAVLSRNLSADGKRAFFETTDPLVIDDTNAQLGCPMEGASQFMFPSCLDVYEWEAQGTGSCQENVQGGGCLYLLSSGTSPRASFFADASVEGEDAFLATRSAGLVRQDQDQLQDIYDARIGGGLTSQNEVPPPPCESLDGCHGAPPPPPAAQSPGSASFSGPGNRKEAHKPAKKPHHKKHHKKRRHKHKRRGQTSTRSSR